jgi:hypothetical protein
MPRENVCGGKDDTHEGNISLRVTAKKSDARRQVHF